MKRNFAITFFAVIALLLGFIVAGVLLQWNQTMMLIVVAAVVFGVGLIFILVEFLCLKKITTLYQNGKYSECIRLSKNMMKWYGAGKNDSALHLAIAVAHFSMGDDGQFLKECEQVIDPRKLAEKYYWSTIFGVVTNNQEAASEQYQLFLSSVQNAQYTELKNRLALLMGIMNTDDEAQRQDLVASAKVTFHNKRILDYLEQSKEK